MAAIRDIWCSGLNGVHVEIWQVSDEAPVEARIEGQYQMKFYNGEYQQAIELCKAGKWQEAKKLLEPKFEAVIPTGF